MNMHSLRYSSLKMNLNVYSLESMKNTVAMIHKKSIGTIQDNALRSSRNFMKVIPKKVMVPVISYHLGAELKNSRTWLRTLWILLENSLRTWVKAVVHRMKKVKKKEENHIAIEGMAVDGEDIMVLQLHQKANNNHIMVGVSARTDSSGVRGEQSS